MTTAIIALGVLIFFAVLFPALMRVVAVLAVLAIVVGLVALQR